MQPNIALGAYKEEGGAHKLWDPKSHVVGHSDRKQGILLWSLHTPIQGTRQSLHRSSFPALLSHRQKRKEKGQKGGKKIADALEKFLFLG